MAFDHSLQRTGIGLQRKQTRWIGECKTSEQDACDPAMPVRRDLRSPRGFAGTAPEHHPLPCSALQR
jgi:hypothetical protein